MVTQRKLFIICIIFISLYSIVLSVNNDTTNTSPDLLDDEEFPDGSDEQSPPFNATNQGKIPLSLCCSQGSLYKLGLDNCNPTTNNQSWTFPPTLYFVDTNQTVADVTEGMFSFVEFLLDSCPDGFVSNSTKDFMLFDDGSLSIGSDRLEVGQFCINEIDSRLVADDIPAVDSQIFAARFCVPDPCITNGPCIRKCCPFGSIIQSRPDELGNLCLPHSTPFDVTQLPFQSSEEAEMDINTTSFRIYDGIGLKCHTDGLNVADVAYSEEFVILADGRMNTTNYPSNPVDIWTTREYCVDHFYDLNETVKNHLIN